MPGHTDELRQERDPLSGEGGFIGRILPGSSDSLIDSIRGIGGDSVDKFNAAAEIGRSLDIRPERSDMHGAGGSVGALEMKPE